jgi:hypothetical protein
MEGDIFKEGDRVLNHCLSNGVIEKLRAEVFSGAWQRNKRMKIGWGVLVRIVDDVCIMPIVLKEIILKDDLFFHSQRNSNGKYACAYSTRETIYVETHKTRFLSLFLTCQLAVLSTEFWG